MSGLPSYPRLMADVAFHAAHARRALERAQAKAPEQDRGWFDVAIGGVESLRRSASRRALRAARRGGIRSGAA